MTSDHATRGHTGHPDRPHKRKPLGAGKGSSAVPPRGTVEGHDRLDVALSRRSPGVRPERRRVTQRQRACASDAAICDIVHRNPPQDHESQNFYRSFPPSSSVARASMSRQSTVQPGPTRHGPRVSCVRNGHIRSRAFLDAPEIAGLTAMQSGWHSLCTLPPTHVSYPRLESEVEECRRRRCA